MNLFAKTNIYIHCLIMRKYYQQTPSLFTILLLSREFQDPIVVYFHWIFFRACMSYTRHDPDRQNRDRDRDPDLKRSRDLLGDLFIYRLMETLVIMLKKQ